MTFPSGESNFNSLRRLSPELEMAAVTVLDTALSRLDAAEDGMKGSFPTVFVLAEQHDIRQTEFPYSDVVPDSNQTAAYYNEGKDRTALISTARFWINNQHKTVICVNFYHGAPFGHFYDRMELGRQFVAPPNRSERPGVYEEATPIWTVAAMRDSTTGSYSNVRVDNDSAAISDDVDVNAALEYNEFAYAAADNEITAADLTSMQLWIDGATRPLSIFD